MRKFLFMSLFTVVLTTGAEAQIVGSLDYTNPTATETEVYLPSTVALGFNACFSYSGGTGYGFFTNKGEGKSFLCHRWPFFFAAYLDYFEDKSVKVKPRSNIYDDSYGVGLGFAYVNRGGHDGTGGFELTHSDLSFRLSILQRGGKNNSKKLRYGLGADLPVRARLTASDLSYHEEDILPWFSTVSPCLFYESQYTVGSVHWGVHHEFYGTLFKNGIVNEGDVMDGSVPAKGLFIVGFSVGVYVGWESKPMLTSK